MKKFTTLLLCVFLGCAMSQSMSAKEDNNSRQPQNDAPAYTIIHNPAISLKSFPKGKDGYYTIFNGTSLKGWRGYGKADVPSKWTIEDKALVFKGSTNGDNSISEGGDLIFAHPFKNFILEIEWKISKGGNSGIFYLAQEVATTKDGKQNIEPIYLSAPEYQVLDNENHPDARLGKNGNRKSASLYDMIPAVPQTAKPYGQWNTAKIIVKDGEVAHYLNGKKVVKYHLWSSSWNKLLQDSKISKKAWPLAFELLNNCGGATHSGYIGLQDHGNAVWYRNIRIKELK